MAVLTTAALSPSLPQIAGPSCSLERSGSLWQLGIEAQELTSAIGLLAEQLQADDDDTRAQAIAALEAALLAGELHRWLFSHGSGIRIESPQSLRDAQRRWLLAALALHELPGDAADGGSSGSSGAAARA